MLVSSAKSKVFKSVISVLLIIALLFSPIGQSLTAQKAEAVAPAVIIAFIFLAAQIGLETYNAITVHQDYAKCQAGDKDACFWADFGTVLMMTPVPGDALILAAGKLGARLSRTQADSWARASKDAAAGIKNMLAVQFGKNVSNVGDDLTSVFNYINRNFKGAAKRDVIEAMGIRIYQDTGSYKIMTQLSKNMGRKSDGLTKVLHAHHLNQIFRQGDEAAGAFAKLIGRNPDEMRAVLVWSDFHGPLTSALTKVAKTAFGNDPSQWKLTGSSVAKYVGGTLAAYTKAGIPAKGVEAAIEFLTSPNVINALGGSIAVNQMYSSLGMSALLTAKTVNDIKSWWTFHSPFTLTVPVALDTDIRSYDLSDLDGISVDYSMDGIFDPDDVSPDSAPSDITSQFAGKTVRIKSIEANNQYLCAEESGRIHATSHNIGQYTVVWHRDNWLSFKYGNSKYISVQDEDYLTIVDRPNGPGAWECFKIYSYQGNHYLLSQKDNKFVQVHTAASNTLQAARPESHGLDGATWERFQVEIVGDNSGGGTTQPMPAPDISGEDNLWFSGGNVYHTSASSEAIAHIPARWCRVAVNFSTVNGRRHVVSNDRSDGRTLYGWVDANLLSASKPSEQPPQISAADVNSAKLSISNPKDLLIGITGGKADIIYDISIDFAPGQNITTSAPWNTIDTNTTVHYPVRSGYQYIIILQYNGEVLDTRYFTVPGEKEEWDISKAVRPPGIVGSWIPRLSVSEIPERQAIQISVIDELGVINDSNMKFNLRVRHGDTYLVYGISGSITLNAESGQKFQLELWDAGENIAGSEVLMDAIDYAVSFPPIIDNSHVTATYIGNGMAEIYVYSDTYAGYGVQVTSSDGTDDNYHWVSASAPVFRVPVLADKYYTVELWQNRQKYVTGITFDTIELPLDSGAFKYSAASGWAAEPIAAMYGLGIIPDYMIYDYGSPTTRLDFLRLAYNAVQYKIGFLPYYLDQMGITDIYCVFTDIEDEGHDRYYAGVLYLFGIITGVGDNKYDPYSRITRQEAAVMLSRIYRFLNPGSITDYNAGNLDYKYADDGNIADWALYGVYNMRDIGVMSGVGNDLFDPKGAYTYEQSIVTFKRLLDYYS